MQQQEETDIESIELTEDQLQAIYMYLAMSYEDMSNDEKLYWNYVLEILDPEYGKETEI